MLSSRHCVAGLIYLPRHRLHILQQRYDCHCQLFLFICRPYASVAVMFIERKSYVIYLHPTRPSLGLRRCRRLLDELV